MPARPSLRRAATGLAQEPIEWSAARRLDEGRLQGARARDGAECVDELRSTSTTAWECKGGALVAIGPRDVRSLAVVVAELAQAACGAAPESG